MVTQTDSDESLLADENFTPTRRLLGWWHHTHLIQISNTVNGSHTKPKSLVNENSDYKIKLGFIWFMHILKYWELIFCLNKSLLIGCVLIQFAPSTPQSFFSCLALQPFFSAPPFPFHSLSACVPRSQPLLALFISFPHFSFSCHSPVHQAHLLLALSPAYICIVIGC